MHKQQGTRLKSN